MAKFGVWIVRTREDYLSARIPIDDTQGAMSFAFYKVHDGVEYQYFSPEELSAWWKRYPEQGIGFVPWGVGRGWNLDNAREEGRLAGRLAAAVQGCYMLDLEPYKEDYWQGIPGTPHAFCEGFREAGGTELWLCPDARNVGINLDEWVRESIVTRWWPQAYYTAFHQPMEQGIGRAVNPLLTVGVPKERIYPVLPVWYDTPGEPSIPADELERAIRYCAIQRFPGISLWRRSLMSPEQVATLLAMEDPFTPVPPPPEPQAPGLTLSIELALMHITEAKKNMEAARAEAMK